MNIKKITRLVQKDMETVEAVMSKQLKTHIELSNNICKHIIESGGKRLRPLLLILCSKAFRYEGDDHVSFAAAVEFFHTSTLLHDDVIDQSELRRGQPTVNQVWGNQASVLVGDFLFTRAFALMVNTNNLLALQVIANAANTIAQGELQQLVNRHRTDLSEQDYLQVVRDKTAALFATAAQIGTILADQNRTMIEASLNFGLHLGNAFQLVDDALDYCADADTIGKNVGDDLRDGKSTLPVIHAMSKVNNKEKQFIQKAIASGDLNQLDRLVSLIKKTDAIDYTYQLAKNEIDKALTALTVFPDSPYTRALRELALFAVERDH